MTHHVQQAGNLNSEGKKVAKAFLLSQRKTVLRVLCAFAVKPTATLVNISYYQNAREVLGHFILLCHL